MFKFIKSIFDRFLLTSTKTPKTKHFIKPERKVDTVFIHCSDSERNIDDSFERLKYLHTSSTKEKIKWGKYGFISCRGFHDVGYHYVITKNGEIHKGRSLEKIPSAQKGFNVESIAICVCGSKNFSKKSFSSLRDLCEEINGSYENLRFRGHCEVSNKTCPVFDYKEVLNLDSKGHIKLT